MTGLDSVINNDLHGVINIKDIDFDNIFFHQKTVDMFVCLSRSK